MAELRSSVAYAQGDVETEAEYNRLHFRMTVRRPDHLESLVARLRASFTEQGVRAARAIGQRLSDDTHGVPDYDLFPRLRRLDVPTLVLHGQDDFIPLELAARIAQAVPGARFSVLPRYGHFAYLECPERVREEIASFLRAT